MQARLTLKPEHEVIAAIHALDLESVKVRMMDMELGEGWTRSYADRIEMAYKTYLSMLVKYQDNAEDILLAKDVDEFWHSHILQTAKYMRDCESVFGNYLHHNPHIGERTAEDLAQREAMAEKTRSLYEQEFGGSEHAAAAWTGQAIKADPASIRQANGAYSAAQIAAKEGAYSAADLRASDAAYSAASIQPHGAAYSAAQVSMPKQTTDISADTAAYSAASITEQSAAYSAASIRAEGAAYSAASIKPQNAAYSAASIRAQDAAYSAASIEARHAAYSAASISAGKAAYSAARVGT